MIEVNIDNVICPFEISNIHCYKEENHKTRIWIKGNKTYIINESFEDFKTRLKIEIKNKEHNKYIHGIKKF
jgi:Na+-translocating ferredoxin:NAD+ oxidoreductase RnfC subunit